MIFFIIRTRSPFWSNRTGKLLFLALFLIAFGITGCWRKSTEIPSPERQSSGEGTTPFVTNTPPINSSPIKEEGSALAESLLPQQDLSPEVLLRDMLKVYAQAKFYADEAYIEALYEIRSGGITQTVTNQKPCSVTFEKPNMIRFHAGSGLLVSDGKIIRSQILSSSYAAGYEYQESPAPLLLSSIKDLYPDGVLADAMDLTIPTNVFWTAPQLILLFANNPLKTLVPPLAQIRLISPALLPRMNAKTGLSVDMLCDRIQITAEDGTRTLWINRNRKTLERFEFPLERLEVPKNVDRIVRLTIEFPNLFISSETDCIPDEKRIFTMELPEGAMQVDCFLPLESKIVGNTATDVSLRSLVSGFQNILLNEADNKVRVVCFWKGINITEESNALLNELDRCAKYLESEGFPVEFIAANCDSITEASDETVRQIFGQGLFTSSLYRFQEDEIRTNIIETMGVPSLLIIDKKGTIQRCYRGTVSSPKLDRDIRQVVQGKDIFTENELFYRNRNAVFLSNLEMAVAADVYYTTSDTKSDEVNVLRPQILPKQITVQKKWSITSLSHPVNPVAVHYKLPKEEVIVVPCEGNNIAVIDSNGQVLQKIIPQAATGELITFIRHYVSSTGQAWFAASALREARKIHRLDDNFQDLGSLNIGSRGQLVADVCLEDINGDDVPELFLALLGDLSASALPVNGLYASSINSSGILWKDESICDPYRMAIARFAKNTDEAAVSLLSLNRPEGAVGGLIENNATTGKRINELILKNNESVVWFAADNMTNEGETQLAVLLTQENPEWLFFALISPEGELLCKHAMTQKEVGRQLEPLVTGDINGDGIKEWIVVFADGTILFYTAKGEFIDRLQYGEEVTGACVAQWKGKQYLIIADVYNITAWEFIQ